MSDLRVWHPDGLIGKPVKLDCHRDLPGAETEVPESFS